jgi:hypothetical protein
VREWVAVLVEAIAPHLDAALTAEMLAALNWHKPRISVIANC